MIHKLLLLIPIFVFTYIHSHAQDKAKGLTTSDSLLTYMGRLMLSGKNLMQEKVYLHFDNTGYFGNRNYTIICNTRRFWKTKG